MLNELQAVGDVFLGGGAAGGELEGAAHLGWGVVGLLFLQTQGENLGGVVEEFAVHHRERLGWDGGDKADVAGVVGVRPVEGGEEGLAQGAFDENVNAAADGVFLGTAAPRGARARGSLGDVGGYLSVNARAGHLEIELAGEIENGVADFLGGKAAHVEPPKEIVVRVGSQRGLVAGGGHLISAAQHDELVHALEFPAAFHELSGEPVEQLRMRGLFADVAKVVRAAHDAAAKVMLPQAVGHHLGGHRIFLAGNPLGEHAAFAGGFAGGIVLGHGGLGRAKNLRERRANLLALQRWIAAPKHPRLLPATLSNGHGEFILHLKLMLLEVGQLLTQLVVLGELGFPKNRLAVQPREQRHGRDIVIHQQTGIDVLPAGGLLAMNGERVAAGLHHVERGLGDIHVKVAIGVALERLD